MTRIKQAEYGHLTDAICSIGLPPINLIPSNPIPSNLIPINPTEIR